MEPEFENRFAVSRKMCIEFYRKHMLMWKPGFLACFWIALGIGTGVLLWTGLLGVVWTQVEILVIAGVVMTIYPGLAASMRFHQKRKRNNGIVPERRVTFGETIEMEEGMTRMSVEYSKIVRVKRLKYSYALMFDKRSGVMLDPDGFTKGSFAEFKAFLRAKRPDLEIPE